MKKNKKRVIELLEIIKVLNRDIKRQTREFKSIIYNRRNVRFKYSIFLRKNKLENKDDGFSINTNVLKDTMKLKIGENTIENDTKIGIVKDIFKK